MHSCAVLLIIPGLSGLEKTFVKWNYLVSYGFRNPESGSEEGAVNIVKLMTLHKS